MAASDFSVPYQYQAMSTGPNAQRADVSGPWSPLAPPFQQHPGWRQEPYQAFQPQSYNHFLPPPSHYRSSHPYPQPNYPRSPYAPYTGPPAPMYFPQSTYSFATHQPRPPPAIRSGHVDSLMGSSRPGADVYGGPPAVFGSNYTGYQELSSPPNAHSAYSTPAQSFVTPENIANRSFDRGQSTQAPSGGVVPQSRQTLPVHPRPSELNQPPQLIQNQPRQPDRNTDTRHIEYTERRLPGSFTTQGRRVDRSSSPRTSARRSFDRYSGDLSHSSTSSDVEEAAARSPPSSRMRHRPRENRPRFFSQQYDPNVITGRQIQELKTTLPKFVLGDLPEDTSHTCDICAKDYSAKRVQPSEEEEVAVKLPCGHSFGEFCIGQWFDTCKTHKNKITCPMCRKQLVEPPPSPYMAGYLNANTYMYAARNSRSFQELLASELQAQYAHA